MKCRRCDHETMHNVGGVLSTTEKKCEYPGCLCKGFETITEEQFKANLLHHEGKKPNTPELDLIEQFVKRVELRAETEMLRTHKLEGAHYRAMKAELEALRGEGNKN